MRRADADGRRATRRSVSPPVLLYRVGNYLHCHGIWALPKAITLVNRVLFSCVLPSTATIGSDFTVGYWGLGVVVHQDAVIGDRCWIMQNVTLGRKAGSQAVPRLGNNVSVGAGSVLLGDIEIGDNCVVGAGSVVTKSFPDSTVIAGAPARIIRTLDPGESANQYLER